MIGGCLQKVPNICIVIDEENFNSMENWLLRRGCRNRRFHCLYFRGIYLSIGNGQSFKSRCTIQLKKLFLTSIHFKIMDVFQINFSEMLCLCKHLCLVMNRFVSGE